MKKIIAVILFSITASFFQVQAQELDCAVRVEAVKAQNIEPRVFQTLETAVYEFMNGRAWSRDKFDASEKIKCSIIINITESPTEGDYKANIIVQSQRPVYNSSYQSPVFSHNDKDADFEYFEFQQLNHIANGYSNNLTSLLAFYAYMILGYDYATFSPNGGEYYFKLAKSVIDAVPQSAKSKFKGWTVFDGTNSRYQLVDALLNPRYQVFNQTIFSYHYDGLDKLYEDINGGRSAVARSLKELQTFNEDNPNSILLKTFFTAKSEEIRNVFSDAPAQEKGPIVDVVSKLDPLNSERYRELLKN